MNQHIFYDILEHCHDSILILSPQGNIEYVNQAASHLMGVTTELLHHHKFQDYIIKSTAQDNENSSKDLLQINNSNITINTTGNPIEIKLHCAQLNSTGDVIILLSDAQEENDQSAPRKILKHTKHLKLLHELTTKEFTDFAEALHEYIKTGLRIFDLETGIISKINDDKYRIIATISPDNSLHHNVAYPLENTYSAEIVRQKKTVSYFHVGAMESMSNHPMYLAHRLEAYMGCPIIVNGNVHGTLIFSSTQPHSEDFDWLDIEIIEMMAQSLGKIIEARESDMAQKKLQKELQASKNDFEETLNSVHDCVFRLNKDLTVEFLNPSAQKILATPLEQLVGTELDTHLNLIIHDKSSKLSDLLNQAIENKSNLLFSNHVKITNPENKEFDIELAITPLFQENGAPNGAVVNIDDITRIQEMARELKFKATHDALTGLSNRMLFDEYSERALARASRYNTKFAVIFCDLNGFKAINDNLGHHVGDELLIEVSKRLQSIMRKTDIISRFGGDEFVTLATDLNHPYSIKAIIDKIEEIFSIPFVLKDHELSIATSIGSAIYADDGTTIGDLLKVADKRMYKDKKQKKMAAH